MGLTLQVGGATITGELIGRDTWLEEMAELMATAGDSGRLLGDTILEAHRQIDLAKPADEPVSYVYVHLRNARILTDGEFVPSPPSPGALWRGRTSEVGGWSIGSMGR